MPDGNQHVRLSPWLYGSMTDRVVLLACLLLIALLWWQVQQRLGGGTAYVYIYHDQTLLAYYPLQSQQVVDFDAPGELGVSRIHIAEGKVSITQAPCRNRVCIRSGEHHHAGDVIACVPNHILVVIRGDSSMLTPDTIAE